MGPLVCRALQASQVCAAKDDLMVYEAGRQLCQSGECIEAVSVCLAQRGLCPGAVQ